MPVSALSSVFAPRTRGGVSWRMVTAVFIALAAHVVLFVLLSSAWLAPKPPPPVSTPIDVSLVDAVALEQRAPPAAEEPAQSVAPETAPPEDAAPAPAVDEPEPTPAPPRPAPPKKIAEAPPEKLKPVPPRKAALATKAIATTGTVGSNPNAKRAKAGGATLGADFREGLVQTPSKGKAVVPPAAVDGKAAADIGSAILRQVQPCANRQVNPGPGASSIVVIVRLHLNRDGSMSARPEIPSAPTGVDDDNRIYVDAVKRNAIATFTGCSPLRGLPDALYDVPRGWKTFSLRYNLPR